MRIKYDRTCQRSIKIISREKTSALHKSAQKNIFSWNFFLKKKALDELYSIIQKLKILQKDGFFTLDDTLSWTRNAGAELLKDVLNFSQLKCFVSFRFVIAAFFQKWKFTLSYQDPD